METGLCGSCERLSPLKRNLGDGIGPRSESHHRCRATRAGSAKRRQSLAWGLRAWRSVLIIRMSSQRTRTRRANAVINVPAMICARLALAAGKPWITLSQHMSSLPSGPIFRIKGAATRSPAEPSPCAPSSSVSLPSGFASPEGQRTSPLLREPRPVTLKSVLLARDLHLQLDPFVGLLKPMYEGLRRLPA
jgi:hypothetical protein